MASDAATAEKRKRCWQYCYECHLLCAVLFQAMKKYFAERFKEKYKNKFGDFSDESFLIIPSFVDVHVHLREPGFFFKETIASGSRAAAASGYGHIFSMPNLNPTPFPAL